MKEYEEFLKEKIKMAHMNGEPCDADEISQVLFPHQRDIVQWCVKGGQRAIFAAFGLGKTLMQAEIMRLLNKKTGCKTLIVCPLGVRQEFMRDGRMIGVNFEFVRRTEDFEASDGAFFLTNYESVRDGKLDPTLFNAVSLDEASCFPKGTLIDTPKGKVKIDLVRIGDIIINAGGVDYVRALHKNHVKRVARINLGGDSILASADHRFFTTRGWVAAEKLQPGDSLVETTKAMLLLRGGDIPQDVGRGEEAFLQQILLSEMANVSKRDSPVNIRKKQEAQKKTDLRAMWQRIRNWSRYDLPEILQQKMCIVVAGDRSPSYARSDKKTREENIGMVEGRKPGGPKTVRENKKAQSNVKPSKQKENEKCSLWKNIFVSWRERQIDGASNIACRDIVVSKDGICDRNGSGKTKVRESSELLQGGCSNTRKEDCDRGGWEDAQTSKMEVFRQEKNRSFKCSRVESVEILESRHPGLDKFREADGELYFYDLSATRHPSYSVNGFLVHNCLRSYGSKTYQEFLPLFDGVKYKFVATATPAPNRYKELIHYAAFLGVADSGQLLTRFFQRDSTQANNLTLYPHSEKEFWAFMHSWAIFLQKPSELGYSDDGYVLPDAEIKFHEVERTDEVAIEKDGQILMFPEASAGLKEAAKEKRISLDTRVQKMKELVEGYISQVPGGVMSPIGDIKDQIIIWCDLNDEQTAAEQVIKSLGLNCSSIYGSLTTEECEKRLEEWRNKETYALIGKPVMLGSGVNLQQCNKAIFLGVSYKFNDTIQAVHRIQRFQQTRTCEIHFIYCESEREVLQTLNRKWTEHNKLMDNMSEIIKEHGLHNLGIVALLRNMGVKRRVEKGHMYEVALNDCVDEARMKEDNSVHLIISSIPFSNHYEYSPNYADMGHTESNDHFWSQMDYLTPELLRILSPGRIAAIHVKDRVLFGNVTGAGIPTISPFHAEAIFHYIKHGFDYMGMITVVTDVVRENNQTYRLGWTENSKDGTKMGVGSPEYVLLFHKPQTDRTRGYADVPVQKDKREYTRAQWQIDAHAFWRSSGNRFLTAEELKSYGPEDIGKAFKEASLDHIYDYKAHVEVGEELDRKGKLPSSFMAIAPGSHNPMVWDDVNRMLTLNGEQTRRGLQSHICLATGSLILTKVGYKSIEDVSIGDLVLTHKGNWKPVIAKKCTGDNPVLQIKAQGVPNLVLTPDHKVWSRVTDKARRKDYMLKTEPGWHEARSLKGQWVNLKLPTVEESNLDASEWWLVGRYLADGHVGTRGDFFISVGKDKQPEFEERAAGYFGSHAEISALQYRLLVKGMSKPLIEMLGKCGHGAENKQVPIEGICLNAELSKALLEGYLSGDGCKAGNAVMACSISRPLLLGMSMVAQRALNVIPSVFRSNKPVGKCMILGREVNQKQLWVMSWRNSNHRSFGAILEDGAWKKVDNVVNTGSGRAVTWSLQVADDASYTAEGCIVKNCPLQFDIVDRLITRYSNKGDLVYDPFGGLMTVPFRAIKLGRRGGASELCEGYFNDGIKYLALADSEMSIPSLFETEELKAE